MVLPVIGPTFLCTVLFYMTFILLDGVIYDNFHTIQGTIALCLIKFSGDLIHSILLDFRKEKHKSSDFLGRLFVFRVIA